MLAAVDRPGRLRPGGGPPASQPVGGQLCRRAPAGGARCSPSGHRGSKGGTDPARPGAAEARPAAAAGSGGARGLARQLEQGWESELRLVVDAAFPRERLMRIVAELQRLCPDTQLQLSDAVLSGAEEAITENRADVVVTTRVPPDALGQWLMDVTFVAVARFDHPLSLLEHPLPLRTSRVMCRPSFVIPGCAALAMRDGSERSIAALSAVSNPRSPRWRRDSHSPGCLDTSLKGRL